MVFGLRGGCSGSGGAWWVGLPGSYASTSMYGWPWAGLAGLGGAGWPRGGEVGSGVPWAFGGGVLWWGLQAFLGALVVSWRPADGDGGRVWGAG